MSELVIESFGDLKDAILADLVAQLEDEPGYKIASVASTDKELSRSISKFIF